MTIVEKILARASGLRKTSPGEYVTAKIDVAMMPEMFRLAQDSAFQREAYGQRLFRLWDPERFVVVIDHRVPAFALAECRESKRSAESLPRS